MTDVDEYRTVAGIAQARHIVKKSRFFGEATAVDTQAAVKEFLTEVQERAPTCFTLLLCLQYWAVVVRYVNTRQMRENLRILQVPPILSAVRAFGLSNIVCIVARYYGGINLGIGD